MSLYDNPLPPADYAAYLALREEMCDLALPYLGQSLERQQALQEVGWHLESIDFDTATARLGETVCRVQFIGRDVNGRWQWGGTTRPAPIRQKPCAMPCISKPTVSSTASNG